MSHTETADQLLKTLVNTERVERVAHLIETLKNEPQIVEQIEKKGLVPVLTLQGVGETIGASSIIPALLGLEAGMTGAVVMARLSQAHPDAFAAFAKGCEGLATTQETIISTIVAMCADYYEEIVNQVNVSTANQ